MSTLLQKELAKNIVLNAKAPKRKNKMDLVASSGYGKVTAEHHSKIILEQKGVQEELQELGFDEDSAKRVVKEILADRRVKPDTRINAAKEIFKVSGSYAPEKRINFNVTPIYGGGSIASVQGHSSDKKDISTEKEDSRG